MRPTCAQRRNIAAQIVIVGVGFVVGLVMSACGDVHDTGVHVVAPTTTRSAAAGPVDSAAQRPAVARPARRQHLAVGAATTRSGGGRHRIDPRSAPHPATTSPVSTLPHEQPVVIIETPAAQHYDWNAIAQCETGGDWTMHGSTYSSALGIMNQAVRENASADVAARVLTGTATRDEQIAIAERMAARFGIHAWACGQKLYP